MSPRVGRLCSSHDSATQAELVDLHRSALPRGEAVPDVFDLACWSRPMNAIGGDLIVAWPVDASRLVVCLIDVMGHGAPAAVVASGVRTALYQYRSLGLHRPGELLDELDRLVSSLFPGYFVTATMCLLDSAGDSLTFAQAGHPALLIRNPRGDVTQMSTPSLPLGLAPEERYKERMVSLAEGAVVVVYSDGVSDALSSPETPGTLALAAVVGACRRPEASRLVQRIRRVVQREAPGAATTDPYSP